MKKIITLCAFAFALLLSTQTTQAQAKIAANNSEVAVQKTKELTSLFKLDKEATNSAFEIFNTYQKKTEAIADYFKVGTEEYTKNKNELDEYLMKQLNDKVLSLDQLKRYVIFIEQSKHKKK